MQTSFNDQFTAAEIIHVFLLDWAPNENHISDSGR